MKAQDRHPARVIQNRDYHRRIRLLLVLAATCTILIVGGLYVGIKHDLKHSIYNAERLATSDIDLTNISLSSLEARFGKHESEDECLVPFANTRFTNCKSYRWSGVVDLWEVEPGTGVAKVTFHDYRGTICGESVQQVRLKKEACGVPVTVEYGQIVYSNPLYHPAN